MKRFESVTKPLKWFIALLLVAVAAGCGNGGNSPILGGGGSGLKADKTRPRVTVTIPANAAVVAPANAAITATFSEAMAPATISGTSFTVTCASPCVSPTGVVSYVVASKTAVFKPAAALTVGAIYTATITTAATDIASNALAGNPALPLAANNYVWTFTASAVDNTAPTVILESPIQGASGVALNSTIGATFSEEVNPATISTTTFTLQTTTPLGPVLSGTVSYDSQTKVASFAPSSNLAPSTQYTATVTSAVTDLAGNALVVPVIGGPQPNPWTFTTGTGLAPGAVALGTAGTFGLMATAAVTAASASIINGDVSLEPGTSITGFPPALVNGEVHVNDTVSHQARNDLLASYNYAKGLACATSVGTADLGGLYVYPTGIPPGVYCSGSTMLVGAHIVLDAGGNADAVWVFQIGSSLTSNADVTLTGGAQAKNVFWVPTDDATIGSGTTFNGTIVTGRDATSAGSATINGRILAGAIIAGTIALNGPPSTVNVPAP